MHRSHYIFYFANPAHHLTFDFCLPSGPRTSLIPQPLRRTKHYLELLGAMGWHPAPSLEPAAVVDALALARAASAEAAKDDAARSSSSALERERERWHSLGLAAQVSCFYLPLHFMRILLTI